MSELLVDKLKNSIGLQAVIFTENGFRFECKILKLDNIFLEIYDTKKSMTKLIKITEINEVNLTHGY